MGSARLGNQVPHVLHLYFHEADVGAVTSLVLHQGTWFGTLERRIAAVEDPTIDMLISFCQRGGMIDWMLEARQTPSSSRRFRSCYATAAGH